MPIKLSWVEPEGGPILSYNVYKRIGIGIINPITDFLVQLNGFQTTYDDTDYVEATLASPGYQYAISANNPVGEGALSNDVLITFVL